MRNRILNYYSELDEPNSTLNISFKQLQSTALFLLRDCFKQQLKAIKAINEPSYVF